ncbi:MAG TPA: MATE family efflux transporter [Lacipirellulaceae bacterium]|nr:MATE family efflux transporter [Lacipirellulaceae bacterium]
MTLEEPDIGSRNSWWTRPGGGREVLRVAAPLVVSSLSWTLMTFMDRVMLNWKSGTAMAAAFSSSVAWFALLCFPLGVCAYTNTFVAQYDGADQPRRVGIVIWQSVWIALGFGLLVLAAIPLAPPLFAAAGHTGETYRYEVTFFQLLCLCGPAMLLAQAGGAFYSGRGQTWVVMIVDSAAALLNFVLDYCWIFGHAGFPEWGLAGAACATVVSTWVKAIVYLLLPLQAKYRDRYGTLAGMRWDGELLRRILRFGGPSGFQMLLDVTGFTVFILLIDRLGGIQAEATSMTFSISTLAYMPIYGLHLGLSVVVGERLGEDRDDFAARATFTALQIAWMYMLAISICFCFLPGIFLGGFFSKSVAQSPQQLAVRQMATRLLQFVSAYNLFDATQMIFVGALKGAGDTRFLFRVSMILASLLGGFSWLCVQVWKLDIFGCWALVVCWCLLAAIIYLSRFLQGRWRTMRVIETDAPHPAS